MSDARGEWECELCGVMNGGNVNQCVECEGDRPEEESDVKQVDSSSTSSPAKVKSTDELKRSDGWECPVCEIRNKNELLRCAACETWNPAAPSQVSAVPSASTDGFSFGSSTVSGGVPEFSFGSSGTDSSSSGFTFGNQS